MKDVKKAHLGVKKSLLKEFITTDCQRTVFMNNGEEFQIQLFNPYDDVIGIEILLNGKKQSNMLVLKPGEKTWLERQLDKSVKFKFETYEVDANNEAVERAIANNGVLEFKFYKEAQNHLPIQIFETSKTFDNNLMFNDYNKTYSGDLNYNANNITCSCNNINNNFNTDDYYIMYDCCDANSLTRSTTKETGRIEEGSYSNQNFKNVHYKFESIPYDIETIKILPLSEKQYNPADAVKRYCQNCGRKLKQQYKFCPYCGEELE